MGSAPLLQSPEAGPQHAGQPALHTKGPQGRGARAPEQTCAIPRPERAGNGLFDQIVDFRALHRAYKRARAGKRGQPAVAAFSASLETGIIAIQNELIWNTWHPGEYERFEVHEPKRRLIYAPAFRDRIVHHALFAALSPLYERIFHPRSYACRVAKGTHAGAAKAQELIRKCVNRHNKAFALKADIQQYFPSVDQEILKRLLRRRIPCGRTLHLLDLIIDTSPGTSGTGIPLGNLTSQLFANIYLHELDHYCANVLRLPGYVRYMDDFVFIHHDKQFLESLRPIIKKFLYENLRLQLNKKTAIFPINAPGGQSVDFLGYRIYATHRRLRRSSVRRGREYAAMYGAKPTPHHLDKLTSWHAHARHAEPRGLMRSVFKTIASHAI